MKRSLITVFLVAACSGTAAPPNAVPTQAPADNPYVAPADGIGSEAPPAGEIWFGTGFDPTTYATEGRLRSSRLSDEVAIVAHFDRLAEQHMTFQVLHGSDVEYKEVISLDAPTDLYGVLITMGAIVAAPGSYTLRFRDVGGHTVASGALKLTK